MQIKILARSISRLEENKLLNPKTKEYFRDEHETMNSWMQIFADCEITHATISNRDLTN